MRKLKRLRKHAARAASLAGHQGWLDGWLTPKLQAQVGGQPPSAPSLPSELSDFVGYFFIQENETDTQSRQNVARVHFRACSSGTVTAGRENDLAATTKLALTVFARDVRRRWWWRWWCGQFHAGSDRTVADVLEELLPGPKRAHVRAMLCYNWRVQGQGVQSSSGGHFRDFVSPPPRTDCWGPTRGCRGRADEQTRSN